MRILLIFIFFILSWPAHAQLLTGVAEELQPSSKQVKKTPQLLTSPYLEEEFVVQETKEEGNSPYFSPDGAIYDNGLVFEPFRPKQKQNSSPALVQNSITTYDISEPIITQPLITQPIMTQAASRSQDSEPVDLQADNIFHDKATNTISASGNVMMVQAGRIFRADEISYNLDQDRVIAKGNVVLNEPNGDIHLGQEVEFQDQFKNGFVESLSTLMADGARFKAKTGERTNAEKIKMKGASYTPCEPCKSNPDAPPAWQLKASKVTYHEDENRVSYNNARFEVYGVPVFYTPYFSHPDGSIRQKSGFIAPSLGYTSNLGAFAETAYYWGISPSMDATLGVQFMTKENPLVKGQFRKQWDTASVVFNTGVTYSERRDRIGGVTFVTEDELRGHVIAEGRWDMNQKWRSGFNINYASDDQYMRQYDITNDDVLENEIYVERFSGRNYAAGRLLSFQDVRVPDLDEEEIDQPEVLPEIIASFLGEPGDTPILGGRWGAEFSTLGLRREGEDQDVNRLSANLNWFRRYVSDFGLLTTSDFSVRGDYYNVRDRDLATAGSGLDQEANVTRVFPQAHIQTSYPLVNSTEERQITFEPLAALTLAPNINDKRDIPNEDSQDVQIDASNLFAANRFPGLDEVEDQSRVTYGIRSGVYYDDNSRLSLFFGQSRRLDEDGNPFPEGSGLNRQESDFVGELAADYQDNAALNYRFQLDGRSLFSQRHEVDARFNFGPLSMNSTYLFAKALEGTDIDESREQLQVNSSYKLSPKWRLRLGGTQDLGEDPGLRRAYTGLDFLGQCVTASITGERNLTDDSSGESDTEIFFRIGLKNLSDF